MLIYLKSDPLFLELPVHFAMDINVIHEALNVEREIRRVCTHEFLQFLTLLIEP